MPREQLSLLCLSSQDTLQLSFSPASFQSICDALEFSETFMPVPADPATSGDSQSLSSQQLIRRAQTLPLRSLDPSVVLNDTADVDSEACFNLFEICNRTGLGMACYVPGTGGAREGHMEMASTNAFKALTFRPLVESVHLPDFGRKVLASSSVSTVHAPRRFMSRRL